MEAPEKYYVFFCAIDFIAQVHMEVKYVKSEDNMADITTKAVDRTTCGRLTDRLAGYEPLTQEEAQG